MTPPGWNGWLHHTVDVAAEPGRLQAARWERPHIGNPTGTPAAIRPKGSTMRRGRARRRAATIRRGRRKAEAPPSFRPALPSRGAEAMERAGFHAAGPNQTMNGRNWLIAALGVRGAPWRRGAGPRRQDQAPDRGLRRTRQDHRPNHLVRSRDRRDGAIRIAADHAARLLLAPADRGAADRRLRRGRRSRAEQDLSSASSPAGCSPTARGCTASSIPSTISG